jgi:hypothetical protein
MKSKTSSSLEGEIEVKGKVGSGWEWELDEWRWCSGILPSKSSGGGESAEIWGELKAYYF